MNCFLNREFVKMFHEISAKMGLKWFRARMSMKKEASKVPAMTGLYRRVSYFEPDVSTIQRNNVSAAPASMNNDSTSMKNEESQCDHSKSGPTSESSSLPIINTKEYDNRAIGNADLSMPAKDVMKERSLTPAEQLNKTNQNNIPVTKAGSDNEIVI